jgi:glycosyltransferase involved in cell wall biosynthesis
VTAPRASVIINNYNYARFLGPAIESALGQSHPGTEVVVVDDGSSDGSREVIAAYGQRIVPVLKDNGGQGSALNAGFAASSGDVVLFLDADDVLLPDAVEAALPHLRDPEVVKVHWSMPIIDAEGRRTGEIRHPDLPEGDLRDVVRREGPLADATLPSEAMSGNAWPRRFLTQVMPIPPELRSRGADTYLLAVAPAFGRVVREATHSLYRVHAASHHASCSFAERLAFETRSLEAATRVVARHYLDAGLEVDLAEWARHPWWGRVGRAVEVILSEVPEGSTFLLADEELWGTEGAFFGRRRVPFPERDGAWDGIPEDDAQAIAEVERWREQGAEAIFFAWPAHWWLEHFAGLCRHLERRCQRLVRDELLVGFSLRD